MAKHPAERLTAHVKSADGVEDAPVSFGLHRDPIEGLKANMNHARQVVRQLTHRIGQVRADVSGCQSALKINTLLEWAPGVGQVD